VVFEAVQRMRRAAFYVCPSLFPAVPVNQPAIRFTVTLHNTLEDVDAFVPALAEALSAARRVAVTSPTPEAAAAVA
jgi:7-keto-8-aminopelargonate synthetase-like enzyme